MRLPRIVTAAILLIACAHPVASKPVSCTPRDNTARILMAPSPNALHPNWKGDAYIGTSWSLLVDDIVKSQTKNSTGVYLRGDLVSPRGGTTKNVFVLAKEWNC